MAFNIPGIPFRASSNVPDLMEAISKGFTVGVQPQKQAQELLASSLANKISQAKAQYAPQQALADLQSRQAQTGLTNENILRQQMLNQFLPESERARISNTEANTGLTGQNILKQRIMNQYLPQKEQAEIAQKMAMGKYYEQGGGAGTSGSKYLNSFVDAVKKDNPNLPEEKVREAANNLAMGKETLNDGTPINSMSPLTKTSFDQLIKAGTTASQINQSNLAHQADAELDVLNKKATDWAKPYGDTFFGYSPQQIMDTSFKSKDPKTQDKLAGVIAANALQFEMAQIRNRIAGGQPGITATHELMNESMQHINTVWPNLSAETRGLVGKKLNEAIRGALKARSKLGIGASATYSKQFDNDAEEDFSKLSDEELKKILG